jgi:cysteine desulfurase / selenocysteine lyase
MNPSEVEKLREDTPGCQHVLHFNNAGAALPPLPVTNAMKEHLDLESTIGGYEAAQLASNKSEKLYVAPEERGFYTRAKQSFLNVIHPS